MNWPIYFLVVGVSLTAWARQDEITPSGISPNKHYSIFVEQEAPKAPIYYVIRNREDGVVVGRFKSSYQPDPHENDFAWERSHSTWIYWRPDSQYVAIDEANHRGIGTVILARRTAEGFWRIPLSSERLMAFTKENWTRGRLFFGQNSWLPRNRASIIIIGSVPSHEGEGDDRIEYEVVVDLMRDAAMVKASKLGE